jgi:pimeloyl-ACP methyl ester carboxylesterase
MVTLRKYGNHPFRIALVHGGPGASGEMTPVARELAKTRGVLEPLQTASTIEGQVEELMQTISAEVAHQTILVGYSWGAWLSFMLAARHPSLVSKLIMVSSAPFTQDYALDTDRVRFERLSPVEREEIHTLKSELDNPDYRGDKNSLMARVGRLYSRVDSFDPLPHDSEADCRWDIFSAVWPQAAALRQSGGLLSLGKDIKCPVLAIHGDYDPHPVEGIRVPMADVIKDFRLILLAKCGHVPWMEREAKNIFYEILEQETEQLGKQKKLTGVT